MIAQSRPTTQPKALRLRPHHPEPGPRPELLEQRFRLRPLFDATVLGEDEASAFAVPIADDEPEWLTLPAPLCAAA